MPSESKILMASDMHCVHNILHETSVGGGAGSGVSWCIQTGRQMDRQTDIQAYRWTDRQTVSELKLNLWVICSSS